MKVGVTAVRINVRWRMFKAQNGRDPGDDEIYVIARWAWKRIRHDNDFVFACQGAPGREKVRGVYEVDEWFKCGEARHRPELRPYAPEGSRRWMEIEDDIKKDERWGFIGHPAACASLFIGTAAPKFNPFNPVTHTYVEV